MYSIGNGVFDPNVNEVRRVDGTVRLEYRAARALQLLCEKRGEVVAQKDLLEHLWAGREVSPNSLAIVIGDLRRALGDEARNPMHIETIAKVGYRLRAEQTLEITTAKRSSWWKIGGAAGMSAILAGIGIGGFAVSTKQAPIRISVGDLRNDTGQSRYDTVAAASAGVVLQSLNHYKTIQLLQAQNAASATTRGDIELSAKLVLWSGKPDVVFVAKDKSSSRILWSGFAFGSEDELPHKITERLAEFAGAISTPRSER